MHDIAHGELHDLSRLGARNIPDSNDFRRNVTRRGAGANLGLDARLEVVVQRHTFGEPHEQHHPHVIIPILPDAECLGDLRHLLDLIVDFCRTDTHAARVECRVRTTMDNNAVMLGPFGKIAMAPDIVEALEIGGLIFRAFGIVPKLQRHARECLGTDQLTFFAAHRLAIVVPDIDCHAKASTLNFAQPDRFGRNAQYEAGHDIRTAGNGREMHVRLDRFIDEGKAFRR